MESSNENRLLIVELETARRRLLYISLTYPDGTPTSGLGTQPIPDGPCGRTGLIPTRLAFADRMNRLLAGDGAKWGLSSIHSTTEEIA
jgi:hypothetical protein